MTKTFSLPPETAAYLDSVRAELADLTPDERDDLLADVEVSLAEEGEGQLAARLGPPALFAAELRAAAGVSAEPSSRTPAGAVFAPALARLRHLGAHPWTGRARAVVSELAPLWWVARAYVAVTALVLLLGGRLSLAYPVVPHVHRTRLDPPATTRMAWSIRDSSWSRSISAASRSPAIGHLLCATPSHRRVESDRPAVASSWRRRSYAGTLRPERGWGRS